MKKVTIVLLALLMILSSAGTVFAHSAYYKVSGNSMYPALQDGDLVEIVSEEVQDGDMVVAVKRDGTKIVKRLMGDRLVSVGDGTSYSVDEVTILGACRTHGIAATRTAVLPPTSAPVLAEALF